MISYLFLGAAVGLVLGFLIAYALLSQGKARLEAQLSAVREQRAREEEYLKAIQQEFRTVFQNLAQEILEAKASSLSTQTSQQLQSLLEPLRQRLLEFQERVEQTHRESMIKIGTLERVGLAMSEEAERLAKALKGEVKTQGDWGEMILSRILEASGLREGHEYVLQGVGLDLRSEQGSKIRPDVVVILPENRHLIIDSKVSLTAYERHAASSDPEEQKRLEKDLVRSLKNHIDGLRERHYQGSGLNCPDFVLMFMPLEPAYALALQADPALFQYAWERKVVLTTPTTLMATLWIIANIWQQAQQTANALEIARQGGALYDKFVGFVGTLEELGRQLERCQNSYNQAVNQLKTGRGNLISRAENLRALGAAASKSLDAQLTAAALESDGAAQD
ncbi:MAG: DNA recombination protein RmuC [Limnochordia bacterium]|nr:DNA recombination protein RmuC [Limnochordia bacterium]MDI9465574.1 DNA recombination protein RmuC [Bacillota bacterium]NLO94949.1 DNA recombination protein RmuC [Bacillota bacterium]HOB39549.1 DNA recombination protein RmuC [Limnochordia bacterium]HOL99378.1 DNA recombination protein RmuC [Limnochordia bacterium]